jgi:predicted RNase H-like HicB family nuclease
MSGQQGQRSGSNCRYVVALAAPVIQGHDLKMATPLKIVVEKHSDGYVAYPLGLARGVVVGQGDTYDAALADVNSAIAFHLESFGADSLAPMDEDPVLEAFVTEAAVPA